MCPKDVDIYTVCAHAEPHRRARKCPLRRLKAGCSGALVTAHIRPGWCASCAAVMGSRTRRSKRLRYPDPASWLTVANYWAFKSMQGWERPVWLRKSIRPQDISPPIALPYHHRQRHPQGANGSLSRGDGLNWEENALWWALNQWAPERVLLQTSFVDVDVSISERTWPSVLEGLVREARHLTLTEWCVYPGKEDVLWAACQRGFGSSPMFGTAVRQEYFLSDAIMDGVPVWLPECEPVSVANDQAIVRKGEVVPANDD